MAAARGLLCCLCSQAQNARLDNLKFCNVVFLALEYSLLNICAVVPVIYHKPSLKLLIVPFDMVRPSFSSSPPNISKFMDLSVRNKPPTYTTFLGRYWKITLDLFLYKSNGEWKIPWDDWVCEFLNPNFLIGNNRSRNSPPSLAEC